VHLLWCWTPGIGATEDADRFGDVGSDTMGHIAEACAKGEADNGRKGPLNLPNLTRLGLVKAHEGSTGKIAAGMDGNAEVIGAYAWAHELLPGKTHRLATGKSPVFRFCLTGDISPITKTASRKNCWINW
jgi:phosphopentomutase